MKQTLTSILLALALVASGAAFAERPAISIDGDVVVDYAVEIDVDVDVDAGGNMVGQYVDQSTIKAKSVVMYNDLSQSRKVTVDATAVGNNADLADGLVDNVVQSVQDSDIVAVSLVNRNLINPRANVKVTSTAVGNNLILDVAPGFYPPGGPSQNPNVGGGATVVQLVEGTDVKAVSTLNGNTFGCWWCNVVDPTVESVAVGNLADLTVLNSEKNGVPFNSTPISVTQFTIAGSNVSALSTMIGNRGRIGPVNVNSTSIGNSLSVSAPSVR